MEVDAATTHTAMAATNRKLDFNIDGSPKKSELRANGPVHPARGVNVTIRKEPDRGLGCNGWFVAILT
jgi:hypothetical protein